MIENAVYYSMETISFEMGLNVLCIQSPILFYEYLESLKGNKESVVVSNDNNPMSVAKNVLFLGDPACFDDFDSVFLKQAESSLIGRFDGSELSFIREVYANLLSRVQDQIWESNLPLVLSMDIDVKNIVKNMRPHINMNHCDSIYDKILSAVDVAGALLEKRTLVMLHIAEYCDQDQLSMLHNDLLRQGLQLIDLEMNDQPIRLTGIRNVFVDADYVQFS